MMLFDRLTRHISCSALLKFSVLMFTAKSLAVFLAPSVPWMYPAFLFQGASFALYTPAAVRYAMLVVDQKDAVKAQAFLTLTASFGSIFSSLAGRNYVRQDGRFLHPAHIHGRVRRGKRAGLCRRGAHRPRTE
jgi:PPP family 3-phenylpropionic acid transporter